MCRAFVVTGELQLLCFPLKSRNEIEANCGVLLKRVEDTHTRFICLSVLSSCLFHSLLLTLISLFFLSILLPSTSLFFLSFGHSFILPVTLFKFYVFVAANPRGRAV